MHTASSVIKPKPARAWNGERSNANLDVLIISLDPLPGQEYTPLIRRLFQASWRHKLAIDICAALQALDQIPATVLVTGTGILQPAARQLLKRLRKIVEDGAYVVFCYFLGDDAPTGHAFQQSFSTNFGLRWRLVPYRCLEFSPNPAAAIPITVGCLTHVYQPRGGLFEGVLCRSAVFLPSMHAHFSETLNGRGWVGCDVSVRPAKDTAVSLPVPAAMAPVGRGWVGVVGSVCADGETDQIIYSMCGLE